MHKQPEKKMAGVPNEIIQSEKVTISALLMYTSHSIYFLFARNIQASFSGYQSSETCSYLKTRYSRVLNMQINLLLKTFNIHGHISLNCGHASFIQSCYLTSKQTQKAVSNKEIHISCNSWVDDGFFYILAFETNSYSNLRHSISRLLSCPKH